MKRYECIKTIREGRTELITFTAGKVYQSDPFHILDESWACIVNDFKEKNYFTGSLLKEHFKELEPIEENDSYTDLDAQEYVRLDTKGLRKGVAICIASALTLGAILYWALTWRS